MKVLGIDPGTAACGYGIVHESDGRLRATCHGWWRTSPRERVDRRLLTIFEGVSELISLHAPDAVALEESYVGADARIALSVGQARGAVLVAAVVRRHRRASSTRRPGSSSRSAATAGPTRARCSGW